MNIKKVINMKDFGKMIYKMEKEILYLLMEINIKVIGIWVNNKVKVNIYIKMVIFMMVNGIMVKNMEMEFLYGKMIKMNFHIKVNFDQIFYMEMESCEIKMAIVKKYNIMKVLE